MNPATGGGWDTGKVPLEICPDPAAHETHVCRDCGAEITLPYARPDSNLEGYWERAYWKVVPALAAALAALSEKDPS